MSLPPDLQRRLGAFLDDEMALRAPDAVTSDVLAAVGRTRRRPAWRIPERWIPMPVTMRLAVVPRAVIILSLLALLVALLAAGGLVAGSLRHASVALPPPTGPARNGLIVFDSAGDIWLASPDGRERRQLTSGPAVDFNPTWSPDGRRIAYLSDPPDSPDASADSTARLRTVGSRPVDLVVSDASATDGRTVASGLDADAGSIPMWSPDGGRIAISLTADRIPTVEVIDLAASGSLIPVATLARYPTWSPDGASLVYQGAVTTSDQGVYRQVVPPQPGDEPERLTTNSGSGGAFAYPQWSPDGTRLLYYAGPDGAHDIWATHAPASSDDPVSIAAEVADEYWPMWSPDGTRIAFQRVVEGTANLTRFVLTGPDGEDTVTLASDPLFAAPPVWSPDGTAIVGYVPDAQGTFGTHLIVLPIDGSAPVLIEAPEDFSNASWQRLAA